ncbi:MAG: 16S rRNA (guanine(527)-N(7))-methyltransferase RsmG [Caulobacterales bacterium]|nr:16S rRNA (guanine(527)-N(7))-methyltransferase RsmG [Caulobacterales bacterium]
MRWNDRVNLVARSTLGDFWRRHALDGAQLADLAGEEARAWVDVGSGAGVPGLCVALMRADRGLAGEVALVEPLQKRAAFLREAVRATGAPARVVADRVEAMGSVAADVVTARALAPLSDLLAMTAELWGPRTIGLFPKGRDAEAEIAEARDMAAARGLGLERLASRTSVDGCVVRAAPHGPDRPQI